MSTDYIPTKIISLDIEPSADEDKSRGWIPSSEPVRDSAGNVVSTSRVTYRRPYPVGDADINKNICTTCNGSGSVTRYGTASTCSVCGGTGLVNVAGIITVDGNGVISLKFDSKRLKIENGKLTVKPLDIGYVAGDGITIENAVISAKITDNTTSPTEDELWTAVTTKRAIDAIPVSATFVGKSAAAFTVQPGSATPTIIQWTAQYKNNADLSTDKTTITVGTTKTAPCCTYTVSLTFTFPKYYENSSMLGVNVKDKKFYVSSIVPSSTIEFSTYAATTNTTPVQIFVPVSVDALESGEAIPEFSCTAEIILR